MPPVLVPGATLGENTKTGRPRDLSRTDLSEGKKTHLQFLLTVPPVAHRK